MNCTNNAQTAFSFKNAVFGCSVRKLPANSIGEYFRNTYLCPKALHACLNLGISIIVRILSCQIDLIYNAHRIRTKQKNLACQLAMVEETVAVEPAVCASRQCQAGQ